MAKADRLWESYHAFSCSSVDTLFSGQLQSVITCSVCQARAGESCLQCTLGGCFLCPSLPFAADAPEHAATRAAEAPAPPLALSLWVRVARSRPPHAQSRHSAYDPFWDLSLPLPPPGPKGVGQLVRMALGRSQTRCDLPSCLRLLCEDENLEKDDGFFCATCKARQKAVKHLRVFRCPKILVLHLKRFSWQNGLTQQKLTFPVGIPTELSLKAVMSSDAVGDAPQYRLYGIVNHSGTISGGHYTAMSRNSGDGQWYSFNDRAVKAEPAGSPAVSEAAYILFYHAIEPTNAAEAGGAAESKA